MSLISFRPGQDISGLPLPARRNGYGVCPTAFWLTHPLNDFGRFCGYKSHPRHDHGPWLQDFHNVRDC